VLDGVRVVDQTTEIAGPYCTKLLADAGADVVKVEPASGDPLRSWRSGGLFQYLNASKRSVTGDDRHLVGAADILVADEPVDIAALWRDHPALVIVTVTPFGCTGPWAGRPATEFTIQASCGSTGFRGMPDQPPLAAGGRLGEWIAGTYAAVGALAALREAERSGHGEHVDVALLDSMSVTMATFPSVFYDLAGRPPARGTGRTIEVPSIEPTSDGFVVFTTNSAQQFHDFLLVMERPDLLADQELAFVTPRFKRRREFLASVHEYTTKRTSAEVLEQAALFRVPAGPVLNGETAPSFEQYVERGVYQASPSGRFRQPRIPYRITGVEPPAFRPAPARPGADNGAIEWPGRSEPAAADGEVWQRPLTGMRVIDLTAWWAGPSSPHLLAALGADVIKVESVTRPDLMRYAAVKRPGEVEQWWEWGPLFHVVNTGKRGITLDLTRPEGIEILERLIRTADVLVENYTPRVMEQFGLDWTRVHELNPRLVMVRMPAFGLGGPWRDRTGFAQTMESMSGMAWVSGFPDGPPVLVRGACDPLAGMHATFAALLALRLRDNAGEEEGGGRHIESVMVEAALNVAAEQVIEFDMTGEVLSREGNRGPVAAPQGVYPCAGDDTWVAIAVTTDDQWAALGRVLTAPVWATGPEFGDIDGRRAGHDRIDDWLTGACETWDAEELAEALVVAGVPAAVVIPSRDLPTNPQLAHRGLFEIEDHPVTGPCAIPTIPFRFSRVGHWMGRPSPTLGQHNDEVLGEVCSDEELAALRAAGIIGDRVRGA
jgi:crotonobetainyl-CoA:carnitine CoA-transferase CaiB-like acyl-CoA transferase